MRKNLKSVVRLVAFSSVAAMLLPFALADASGISGHGRPSKPKPGITRGAPGPVAGVGLPFVLVAGGYVYLRRRKSKSAEPADQA